MTTAIICAFALIFVLAFWLLMLTVHYTDTQRVTRNLDYDRRRMADWQKDTVKELRTRRQELAALAVHLHITYGYREPSPGEVYIIDQEKQPAVDTRA